MAYYDDFKPAIPAFRPATQNIKPPFKPISEAIPKIKGALGDSGIDYFRDYYNLVAYFGGRYKQLRNTMPYIEMVGIRNNAHTYIELFGGGGKCVLNLDTLNYHFERVIYNEWDKGMCSLFEVAANEELAKQLVEELRQIDYTEDNFNYCKQHKNDAANSLLESAIMAYIVCQTSFSAGFKTFRKQSYQNDAEGQYYNHLDNILLAARHLEGVEVINGDYKHLMEQYGMDAQVVKYLDPPFHPATRSENSLQVYPNELSREQQQKMVSLLCKSRNWVMSGYDPAQYGCADYKLLEEHGAIKLSLGKFQLSTSNDKIYKEEFIWYKV